jgi:multiple sugar transport system permease protein
MTDSLAAKAANPKAVLAGSGAMSDASEGMSYLHNVPRRLVTLYLPLTIILLVLLFPFYWMALTSIKPDEQLLDLETFNPFWTWNPTFKHIYKLLFETQYPVWLWNTMLVAVCATIISIIASVLAAYAIVRLRYKGARWVGGAIFLAYLIPPSILFIPLSTVVFQYGIFDTPLALILTYPTILIPFSTWLLMGYFKTIPFELEECALIDGASRWQILTRIIVLERIYLRADLHQFHALQDSAGGDRHRAGRWRYLSLGFADGRRDDRFAAAGRALCVLRGTLRLGDDRRDQGIAPSLPADA